jgi:hypothetical protein
MRSFVPQTARRSYRSGTREARCGSDIRSIDPGRDHESDALERTNAACNEDPFIDADLLRMVAYAMRLLSAATRD